MALSVLKDIRKIFAGLNADEVRDLAAQEINVGLIAAGGSTYRKMEDFLAPPALGGQARSRSLRAARSVEESRLEQTRDYDFVLCEPGVPVPANGYVFEPGSEESLLRLIAEEREQLELPLARTFPAFRPAVSRRIVSRVARENALFSLVTALPNVIPNLLELPWAASEFATDTAFLTTNQVRMALLLAAAHGQPVGYREQKAQIAGIVAGAFGWRAIARELVGKIPLGGGLIPKAAVAFAGTYVVGLGLEKVNRTGARLTREERREAYADAFARGREAVRELAPGLQEEDRVN
jgi:uncharacterized protein (DUF697 family)